MKWQWATNKSDTVSADSFSSSHSAAARSDPLGVSPLENDCTHKLRSRWLPPLHVHVFLLFQGVLQPPPNSGTMPLKRLNTISIWIIGMKKTVDLRISFTRVLTDISPPGFQHYFDVTTCQPFCWNCTKVDTFGKKLKHLKLCRKVSLLFLQNNKNLMLRACLLVVFFDLEWTEEYYLQHLLLSTGNA